MGKGCKYCGGPGWLTRADGSEVSCPECNTTGTTYRVETIPAPEVVQELQALSKPRMGWTDVVKAQAHARRQLLEQLDDVNAQIRSSAASARSEGASMIQIAEALGVSRQRAYELVKD